MSAAAALARAHAAGVVLEVEGGNLRLRGAEKPPADLLAELRTHKAEVVALLTADADPLPLSTALALPVIPLAVMVEAMAEAMAANPVYRITNREKAMDYFRGVARNRLAATEDPLARGLMLGWERHKGTMVVHSQATGR